LSIIGLIAIPTGAASAALLGSPLTAGAKSFESKTTTLVVLRQKSAARASCKGGCPQPPPAPPPPDGGSGPFPGGSGKGR